MLSAISAWLASQGASLLLGALVRFAEDTFNSYLAAKAQRDLATARAESDQANATIAAQQAELQAQADAPKTVDAALKRFEDGTA